MTTIRNALHHMPAGGFAQGRAHTPLIGTLSAAAEEHLLLGAMILVCAGAAGVVLYALGQIAAFH